MAVTAALIKELRERTGAGMVDCKKVLVEADGNIEKAIELLREKGLAAASKKAGRIAAEGLAYTHIDNEKGIGVIVEVNSETDFVAKNSEFVTFVENVAEQVVNSNAKDMDEFMKEKWIKDNSLTVEEALSERVSVIGEKLTIRRFDKFVKSENGVLISYVHAGGKVAVMLELISNVSNDELLEAGRNICMQIAAMNPKFVNREEVSPEFIAKEREILTQQALSEGKPANIVEKMIEGRLNKGLKEYCLLDQEYVKDGDMNIKQYVASVGKSIGTDITVKRFVRFETGEGIEKKEENFADEVNKAIQG